MKYRLLLIPLLFLSNTAFSAELGCSATAPSLHLA